MVCQDIMDQSHGRWLRKGKKKVIIKKTYCAINAISYRSTWKKAKLRQIEKKHSYTTTDLLQLLVLLCGIIMQQYTLQCTICRNNSATLPLPPDEHHISDVAVRRLDAVRRPLVAVFICVKV